MNFLPDVYVPCEVCHGKRYNHETLQVKYRGLSIADVLDLTVEEAMRVFENHNLIMNKLQTLYDVGTGLHVDDVSRLVHVLQQLVDAGNSVLVIEHNLDVLKTADYLIDLGPEGGDAGGEVIAAGTPEEVAACEKSYTGQYLLKTGIAPEHT